ncbi:MAG: 2-C-methyl-D-erythritol 4-phosphate cytidylyltransferase [Corynebacteriales bacterium]|nr:2-C-methyl-D-erythritol 4-phosphate cytidylyltransferase [Mycobacteriales bacterium]
MGGGVPKALRHLCAEPLLTHALREAFRSNRISALVVVGPKAHQAEIYEIVSGLKVETSLEALWTQVVPGGRTRTESVTAGLAALRERAEEHILVHDAARALAPAHLFGEVIDALRSDVDAVVPALPVVDTIKQVDSNGHVMGTVDRNPLRAIQTPQGFTRTMLERVHACAVETTDDAALVEKLGGIVVCVSGSELARKVTTPADMAIAEALLNLPAEARER